MRSRVKTLSATAYVIPVLVTGIQASTGVPFAVKWILAINAGMTDAVFGTLFTPSMEQRA